MFGRDIRTRFNVLVDRSGIKHRILGRTQRKQFNAGQTVQARNYYGKNKWNTRKAFIRKEMVYMKYRWRKARFKPGKQIN